MEKVSVIVPAYNAETGIERCIYSILQQDYYDFELIVVNDGSNDATSEIINNIAKFDHRIIIIEQENKGEIAARAAGIRKARGQWLYFVDADDTIMPDALSSMLLYADSNVEMVVFEYPLDGIISRDEYYKILFSFQSWTMWGKLFRRELFDERVMNVPRYFKTGGDFLTQIRLVQKITKDIVLRPEYKYIYNYNNPLSVQKSTYKDYEYEKNLILEVQEALPNVDKAINTAMNKWKLAYLSGMIGLKYDIDYGDCWIVSLKKWADEEKLSFKEKLAIRAINEDLFRKIFIIEKTSKVKARAFINFLKRIISL